MRQPLFYPIVSFFFEFECELRASRFYNASFVKYVHEIGCDVIEQPLVVRDDDRCILSDFSWFTPCETIRKASMSRPLSVSSRMDRRGCNIAIWKISFRFFSPPENPSLTERLANLLSSSTIARFSRIISESRWPIKVLPPNIYVWR